jgi:YD repeat-containing protein
MVNIIVIPQEEHFETAYCDKSHGFGYFETQHARDTMEDALAWHTLSHSDLSPEEIGYRLWTSYQLLDQKIFANGIKSGNTASTTVYDGRGNLITATLADSSAFAVMYDKQGDPLAVVRLNSVVHKPTTFSERMRIQNVGGIVSDGRVSGVLAVSRAIGDWSFKLDPPVVVADAKIDIFNIHEWIARLGLDDEDIGSVQVISCCDGFTDGAGSRQTKEGHQAYLYKALSKFTHPGKKDEDVLARELAAKAIQDGSKDNITIGVQTIYFDTGPIFLGVYDGHLNGQAAVFTAENIGKIFKAQCGLSQEMYAKQAWSVHTNMAIFTRDNDYFDERHTAVIYKLKNLVHDYQSTLKRNIPEHRVIRPILEQLHTILRSKDIKLEHKISQFYTFLNAPGLKRERHTVDTLALKNIDLIKRDPSKPAKNFLKGIAIIVATLFTGVLPGLLIIGIVWAATGRHPGDLFKAEGYRFEKELGLIETRHHAFFKPQAPTLTPDQRVVLQIRPST